MSDMITLYPWSNDTRSIYPALDALVIPSSYEGVPLVMIEAIDCCIPVIATKVGGMAEFLPEEWLFDRGDDQRLITLILSCRSSHIRTTATMIKNTFAKIFSKEVSRMEFVDKLCNTN